MEYAVDISTGQFFEAAHIVVPIGTQCITPADREIIRKKSERARRKTNSVMLGRGISSFYFVIAKEPLCKLSPATLGRLVYLSSFLEYEGNRLVTDRNMTAIKQKDLPKLLSISDAAVTEFLKETLPTFLMKNKDGELMINNDFFRFGQLSLSARNKAHHKVFRAGIRKLYRENSKKARYIGYILKALPHISIEFNVMCWNPFERSEDLVEPMSLREFGELIGYDRTQISRLKKIYDGIYFDAGGKHQRLLAFSRLGAHENAIIVNPCFLYSGSDIERVRALANHFA